MDGITLLAIGIVLLIIIVAVFNSIKIVQEYERGVVFRLGRLVGPRGPGLFLILPILDRIVKIDLRVVTLEIPTQEVITKDNVSVRVNAVLYFRVYDPAKAVVNVTDFIRATLQIAQTTLRSVLGQSELDELLSQRDKINDTLQHIIDEQTEPWGIKVSIVEVKDVELPQSMQRAMARQAEAEREKRAKVIHAEGELQASETLSHAAHIIGQERETIQLRYLQTLTEIATERNSTIIFPIPIDILSFFTGGAKSNEKREEARPSRLNDETSAQDVKSNGQVKSKEALAANEPAASFVPPPKTTTPLQPLSSQSSVQSSVLPSTKIDSIYNNLESVKAGNEDVFMPETTTATPKTGSIVGEVLAELSPQPAPSAFQYPATSTALPEDSGQNQAEHNQSAGTPGFEQNTNKKLTGELSNDLIIKPESDFQLEQDERHNLKSSSDAQIPVFNFGDEGEGGENPVIGDAEITPRVSSRKSKRRT